MQPLTPHRSTAVLGHRGLRSEGRENTIEAFRAAARQGADGVELDVRRTRDGALVIHHDPAVDGTVIADIDFAAARQRWPWMPTLDEALDACAGMLVNVEVKNDPNDPNFDPDDRAAVAVAATLARRGAWRETLVSSFYPPTVQRVRSLDERLRTGQLLADVSDPVGAVPAIAAGGHQAVNPWVRTMRGDVAGELVRAAHAAGLWVMVWTVNEPDDLRHLAAAGVDAVIVDDPAGALAVLAG